MGYKWKPSKAQRKAFAEKMNNDTDFAREYNDRKLEKAKKRRESSKFDYDTAGGEFVPTKSQYDAAIKLKSKKNITYEQNMSCDQVMYGFTCQEKIHHDHIHVINEFIRNN